MPTDAALAARYAARRAAFDSLAVLLDRTASSPEVVGVDSDGTLFVRTAAGPGPRETDPAVRRSYVTLFRRLELPEGIEHVHGRYYAARVYSLGFLGHYGQKGYALWAGTDTGRVVRSLDEPRRLRGIPLAVKPLDGRWALYYSSTIGAE